MAELQPPRKSVELEDPGAHDLESSEGDEHFSDASEGRKSDSIVSPTIDTLTNRSKSKSPVPITRVERVDAEPSHGEVPGTEAYKIRIQDAVPDEVEIVPEGARSRSASIRPQDEAPPTPSSPIPKTVVEKVDPDVPSHGDVPGTYAHELRKADAEPDEVVQAPEAATMRLEGLPTPANNRSPVQAGSAVDSPRSDASTGGDVGFGEQQEQDSGAGGDEGDGGGGGDDFDDFEEGGGEEEFGDFDDNEFQQAGEALSHVEEPIEDTSATTALPPSLPALDFDELDTRDKVIAATQPYIDEIFPFLKELESEPLDEEEFSNNSSFLSERSQSLWSQLVAPPPLNPPNWVRSRTRRLFLVSLGVPVDLDEILPASKQKKLVLPSINISGDSSPRPSGEARGNGKGTKRGEQPGDSSSSRTDRGRRGVPSPPQLEINSTRILGSTTDAALGNFTDEELQAHVQRLTEMQALASSALEYWLQRRDSALGDKEAFEGVIENLVKHAKKSRK